MKARIPRAYHTLPYGQKKRIEEYSREVALEAARMQTEKDGRIMLDLYIKMVCVTLHDAFGFDEEQLTMFLGNHKRLFHRQARMVRDGEQIEYLNARMAEMFPKNGFPQSFFDNMLGDVPSDKKNEEDLWKHISST